MTEPFHLLYIDDDPALGRLIQKDFARRGHQVDLAHDGEEGLKALSENRYDAVALDHYMPGRDGLEVLPEILALEGAPTVIYVTGVQDGRVAVAALRAGAADYVIKDVSNDFTTFLEKAVADAILRRRLEQENLAAQEEVRRERDRAEALLREVNHRVGNSLQLVSSFIHLHRRQLAGSDAEAALAEAQVRIEAVSQVHRRLYQSHDMRGVALDEYLGGLVDELSQSLLHGRGPTLSLKAEPIFITTDQAVSVGVVVAELVTNAVKYAYGPNGEGEIRILATRNPNGTASVRVEDDGAGMGDGSPKGTGLGSQILKAMASDLRGEIRFETSLRGTHAVVDFTPDGGVLAGE